MNLLSPKDLFIVGPTASGKSKFAIELAKSLDLSLVNCDSLQFFSDLKIGTAYPSDEDILEVPHLLYGIVKAGDSFTAGDFIRQFEVLRKNPDYKIKNFLIVGGSGFYIQALETGMEEIETLTEEMKHKISFLNELTLEEKIKKLNEVDPESLNHIHVNDEYRIHRALEVFFSQGKKISEVKRRSDHNRHQKLGLYLDRDELLKRVTSRIDDMLKQGLIDEVQGLVNKGLSGWKPLQSVGYKEVLMFLNNEISHEQMKYLIAKNTMNLVKRQMTWFRSDSSVVWFHTNNDKQKALDWAASKIDF